MRLSSLALLVLVVLFSFFAFAQHSSGGGGGSSGGSSSSSSSSSGGGSHGGSSGGSSNSGGSSAHSSGGGSFHSGGGGHASSSGSSNHGSGAGHGSSSSSKPSESRTSNLRRSPDETHPPSQGRPVQTTIRPVPEKRSFFSFLRYPFRKPEPKRSLVQLPKHPICFRGLCSGCPIGQVRAGSGCAPAVVPIRKGFSCSHRDLWNGGACLTQVPFLDDCAGQRTAMDRQLRRMRDAEIEMQSLCSASTNQACSDASLNWNSEQSLYRTLQARYQRCMASGANAFYSGRFTTNRMMFDPLTLDVNY